MDRDVRSGLLWLIRRADTLRSEGAECAAGDGLASKLIRGWSLVLSAHEHLFGAKPGEMVEHWHLSVQLHPKDRAYSADDWALFGRVLAALSDETANEGDPHVLTPYEATDPRAVYHFVWHDDGSTPSLVIPTDGFRRFQAHANAS